MDDYELYHYGIKGQRWGIRRYQNKYGALTPAGKKRRAKLESDYDEVSQIGALSNKGKKRKAKIESEYKSLTGKSVRTAAKTKREVEENTRAVSKKKSVREMSDDELKTVVDRMNLEGKYREYYKNLNPEKISVGKKFVNKVGNEVLAPAATEMGKQAVSAMMQKAFEELSGIELQSKKKKK